MRKFWTRWGTAGKQQAGRALRAQGSASGGREVRIGLDLGVATTRCIVNLLGRTPAEDECLALALEDGRTCMPSTISVEGDHMRTGSAAESSESALRSVLMWLPMLAGDTVDTSVSGKYDHLRQTVFKFGDHMISAKEVVILYLERVLGRVLAGLDLHLGAGRWHGVLRVAAPAAASSRYRAMLEEIVSLALDLAVAADGREPSMTESLSGLTERYQRGSGRAPNEQCQVVIVSDSEAAAVALAAAAGGDATRRVVAVDMGAGTTTATCFLQKGSTVTLRGVKGVFAGMDDIDQLFASARAVRKRPPRVFREATALRSSDRPMIRRGLDLICSPLREALGVATRGGQEIDSWCSGRRAAFDFVLLGGGACCEVVRDEFSRRTRTPLPGAVEFWDVTTASCTCTREWLACNGSMPRGCHPIDEGELPLLVLAEGLALRGVSLIAGHRRRRTRTSVRSTGSRVRSTEESAAERARDARFGVH